MLEWNIIICNDTNLQKKDNFMYTSELLTLQKPINLAYIIKKKS